MEHPAEEVAGTRSVLFILPVSSRITKSSKSFEVMRLSGTNVVYIQLPERNNQARSALRKWLTSSVARSHIVEELQEYLPMTPLVYIVLHKDDEKLLSALVELSACLKEANPDLRIQFAINEKDNLGRPIETALRRVAAGRSIETIPLLSARVEAKRQEL